MADAKAIPDKTLADRAHHLRRDAVRMGEVQGQDDIAQRHEHQAPRPEALIDEA